MSGDEDKAKPAEVQPVRERCPYWAAHLTVCLKAGCSHWKRCHKVPNDPRLGKGL